MKWMKMLIVLTMLAGSAGIALAGDGAPPSVEEVCDVVKYGAPGLFGLCIAFCEAQDCEPDPFADDPFENCQPGSERVLANYRRKMEPGDPEMPCLKDPCPCWTQDEIDSLRYPQLGDATRCWTATQKGDFWRISDPEFGYSTSVRVTSHTCSMFNWCSDSRQGECFPYKLTAKLSADEHAICLAQLRQAGADRGFDCFQ